MRPLIIGIAGKIGVGKHYIIKKYLKPMINGNVLIVAFADHLKVDLSAKDAGINLCDCLK